MLRAASDRIVFYSKRYCETAFRSLTDGAWPWSRDQDHVLCSVTASAVFLQLVQSLESIQTGVSIYGSDPNRRLASGRFGPSPLGGILGRSSTIVYCEPASTSRRQSFYLPTVDLAWNGIPLSVALPPSLTM